MGDNGLAEQSRAEFSPPESHQVPHLARRAVNWSALLLAGRYAVSAGTTAVLVRFVSPYEYGLMGMVATLTVLAQVIADFGLSSVTVQRPELTREQINALWLINAGFGLVLTGSCVASAPLLARFYSQPALVKFTMAASVTLLLSALSAQPLALMRRQMRLRPYAITLLAALCVASPVAMVMAIRGFGVWALVAQGIAEQGVILALAFPMSGFRPRLPRRWTPVGSLLSFGSLTAAFGLVTYCSRNLDNVLIGRYWGAVDLGHYARAYFLMQFPGYLSLGMYMTVAVPAMAAMQRSHGGLQDTYVHWLRRVALTICPIAAGLVGASYEVVGVLYGRRWLAVVPILLWLSIASLLQPVTTQPGIYLASGRGRSLFRLGVIVALTSVASFSSGCRRARWGWRAPTPS